MLPKVSAALCGCVWLAAADEAWVAFSNTNCYGGHGAGHIAGKDPVPGHKKLHECQAMCLANPECDAIVMHDTKDGDGDNCWFRKQVVLKDCDSAGGFDLWLSPSYQGDFDSYQSHVWLSYHSRNCYPGHGGEYVKGANSSLGHLLLFDCEAACLADADCEGFVWHDTRDGYKDNCYLRANISLDDCEKTSEFNLRLLKRHRVSEPAPWPAFSSRNCHSGAGAESIAGKDPVPGHKSLKECQEGCLADDECDAIVMHDTKDGNRDNCWFRKNVNVDQCALDASFDLWLSPAYDEIAGQYRPHMWRSHHSTNCFPGYGGDYVKGEDSLSGHRSLIDCEAACLAAVVCEGIVWRDTKDGHSVNCYLRAHIELGDCVQDESFNLRLLVRAPPSSPAPWPALSSTNCHSGKGADPIPGKDPVPGHKSLQECQEACLADDDCDAVMMHDTKDGHRDNCWFRKNVKVDECDMDASFDLWLSPAYGETAGKYRPHEWLSHHSTNCYPGHGAEYVKGKDSLPGHRSLFDCEAECLAEPDCEGIVWHDTKDGHTDNCYLRAHIALAKCERVFPYNLRLLIRGGQHKPAPWPAFSSTNCHAGKGAEPIAGKDPVPGHKTLQECQEECLADNECDAVVMHDTNDGKRDNCWFRKDVKLDECGVDASFDLWLSPAYSDTARKYRPHTWMSHHGTNCFPGQGGEYVNGKDSLPGHHHLFACEAACLAEPSCEGIVWHDTQDGHTDNCYLRAHITLDNCSKDAAFNLRLLVHHAKSAPWRAFSSANCHAGKGADPIPGKDPAPGHKSLQDCQLECLADDECDAIVMHDTQDGNRDNCWFRKNVHIDDCDVDVAFDVWLSPAYGDSAGSYRPHIWMSHHGTNCHPGRGGEYVKGQDSLPGHRSLFNCEAACLAEADCEGIVWHDTKDGHTENCFLRAHISLGDCARDPAFNLRLLVRGIDQRSAAWRAVASKNCYKGKGAEQIGGQSFLPGHKSLQECQRECIADDKCDAVVMHDTSETTGDNCGLRKNIKDGDCEVDNAFHVWLSPAYSASAGTYRPHTWVLHESTNCHPGHGGDDMGGEGASSVHRSLFNCETACLAKADCEGIVWHSTKLGDTECHLRAHIVVGTCEQDSAWKLKVLQRDDALDALDASDGSDAPDATPWLELSGKNCYAGRGAQGSGGKDFLPGHKSLFECQKACLAADDCDAVVMHDMADANGTTTKGDNCGLRQNIKEGECETDSDFHVWLSPAYSASAGTYRPHTWILHESTNCHPRHGGDDMVGEDALSLHQSLFACMEACLAKAECDGIVWHAPNGQVECNLRTHIAVDKCEPDPTWKLRLLTRGVDVESTPWTAFSSRNCYTGWGADHIAGKDPVPGHKSLQECQRECLAHNECDAVVMHDTKDGNRDNCWFRKTVNINDCAVDSAFDVWLSPAYGESGGAYRPHTWVSHAGTNCFPGQGGGYVKGEDALSGHRLLFDCEVACLAEAECEGIVWHDTKDGYTDNCYLRARIEVGKCVKDPAFNLRLLNRGADAKPAPWSALSSTNCYFGKGAENVAGKDPVPGHKSLQDCQRECFADAQCDAIVMHDTRDGHRDNCWLRKNVRVDDCAGDSAFDVWLSPAYGASAGEHRPHKWLSHAGTNCYPGHGGEYVKGEDALSGHRSLFDCEASCLAEAECEGIVWHDTKDGHRDNCYLRARIALKKCSPDPTFNLRLLIRDAQERSAPWPAIPATRCSPDGGAEFIPGKDPLAGRKSLRECQEECLADDECDAVVMHTQDDGSDNCFLRKSVKVDDCAHDDTFALWLSPAYSISGGSYRPHKWMLFPSMSCSPGHGGEYVAGDSALSGHRSLFGCEAACLAAADCEGIVWRQTNDGRLEDCYLRSGVELGKCEAHAEYSLRLLTHVGEPPAASWREFASTDCRPGSGAEHIAGKGPMQGHKTHEECQQACLEDDACDALLMQNTKDGKSDNCWLLKKVRLEACNLLGDFDLWLSPAYSQSASKYRPHKWISHPGTNCFPGKGGDYVKGDTASSGFSSLSACTDACLASEECEGIVWRGTSENCQLRSHIALDKCEQDPGFTLRLLTHDADDAASSGPWRAFSSTNCHSGRGADHLDGKDPLPGHKSLRDCQHACLADNECDAVVMHDTKDGHRDNCWFRKNVLIDDCEGDVAFDLWLSPAYGESAGEYRPHKWMSRSGTNCFPGHGGGYVNGEDALSGHRSLFDCEAACLAEADCEGIVWRDTKDGHTDNCFLRAQIVLDKCQPDPDFNLRLLTRGVDSKSAPWQAFSSLNCHSGKGADPISDKDPVPGYRSLQDCQVECLADDECDAVVMHDTKDGSRDNCWLRKGIRVDECDKDASFDLWLSPAYAVSAGEYRPHKWMSHSGTNCVPGHGGEYVNGEDSFLGHRSLFDCEAACLAETSCEGIVWRDTKDGHTENCHMRTRITLDLCITSPDYNVRVLTRVAAQASLPWRGFSSTNCHSGKGAENIAGKDPVPGHKLLHECQEECLADDECDAIVMHDTKDGHRENCWFRKTVKLDECVLDGGFDLWLSPAYGESAGVYRPHKWMSHSGMNCYPGHGAEYVNADDSLPGHRSLLDCESACLAEAVCGGIVWRDTRDGLTSNCHLRAQIVLDHCEANVDYNLRLLVRGPAPDAPPWTALPSTNCFAGVGAESIPGKDPLAGHKTLQECQTECLVDAQCDAIVMLVDHGDSFANCWLRKKVDLKRCRADEAFNLWISPAYDVPAGAYRPHTWTSHAGVNCHPGHGAELVSGDERIDCHRDISDCELACLGVAACQGIIWRDTHDDSGDNCCMRASIDISSCELDTAFNLRLLMPGATTTSASVILTWVERPETSCSPGHGGDAISGADPVSGHLSSDECMDACKKEAQCEAIAMQASTMGDGNCHLRQNIALDLCRHDTQWNIWVVPGFDEGVWTTYPDTNCALGLGAESVTGADAVTGQRSLLECQRTCFDVAECEGFIWSAAQDATTANCFLRKNIVVTSCTPAPGFKLRLRTDISQSLVAVGHVGGMLPVPQLGSVAGATMYVALGVCVLVFAAGGFLHKRTQTGYSTVLQTSALELHSWDRRQEEEFLEDGQAEELRPLVV